MELLERLEQLRAVCSEQLETAALVQGRQFANAAGTVFEIDQVVYLIGELINRCELEESERMTYMTVASNLLSSITQQVLSELPRAQAEEALKLGESMGDRFETMFSTNKEA